MKDLLNIGKSGWIQINMGEKSFAASYITDVPLDFLTAFENYVEYGIPSIINVDGEDKGEAIVMVTDDAVFLIRDIDIPEIYRLDISKEDYMLEICKEIKSDIKTYAEFDCDSDIYDEDDLKNKEKRMLAIIKMIEQKYNK